VTLANLSTDVTRMGSGLRESMECGTVILMVLPAEFRFPVRQFVARELR
jgi:hypothetical protein